MILRQNWKIHICNDDTTNRSFLDWSQLIEIITPYQQRQFTDLYQRTPSFQKTTYNISEDRTWDIDDTKRHPNIYTTTKQHFDMPCSVNQHLRALNDTPHNESSLSTSILHDKRKHKDVVRHLDHSDLLNTHLIVGTPPMLYLHTLTIPIPTLSRRQLFNHNCYRTTETTTEL